MKAARGKPRRPSPAAAKSHKGSAAPAVSSPTRFDRRLTASAGFFLWLLVLVPPFLLSPIARENFRQPKLLASEWFALASLVCFAWGLRRLREVRLADLWRLPAVRVAAPMLLVATATLATTRHPLHAREGLIDLWIGAACLVGWSVALPSERLERLLHGLLVPATAIALLGIVQFHGWWQPLGFFGLEPSSRMAITSLAGNPGDLGAYLVLPVLIAQAVLRRRRDAEAWSQPTTWATAAGLAVCVYGLLITQTLSAIAAFGAGSLLLWWNLLPRRRAIGFLAAGAVAATVLVVAVAPLRERVVEKTRQVAQGDLNAVLTGRLDGWRTAVWMLREQPFTGVGHGAYRTEYIPAKLALLDRGVGFFREQQLVFVNAHNEALEVGAEWGFPGLLALGWALWVLFKALRRKSGEPETRALAWGGVAALAILSLVDFPFQVALVTFPALLFLSGVLSEPEETV